MLSFSRPTTLRTLPMVLLATAWLAACSAGTGSGTASPGVQSRPSASGGADVLTREQIDRINASTMEQLLSRRFNGVQVLREGSELLIRIRGESNPLLVLDGVPGLSVNSLWQLNPSDIEEIRVLRESGTALYGLEGANGVLLITTRRK